MKSFVEYDEEGKLKRVGGVCTAAEFREQIRQLREFGVK